MFWCGIDRRYCPPGGTSHILCTLNCFFQSDCFCPACLYAGHDLGITAQHFLHYSIMTVHYSIMTAALQHHYSIMTVHYSVMVDYRQPATEQEAAG